MVKEEWFTKMDKFMRETSLTVEKMGMEFTNGRTIRLLKGNMCKIKSMDSVNMWIQTGRYSKENGVVERCKARA